MGDGRCAVVGNKRRKDGCVEEDTSCSNSIGKMVDKWPLHHSGVRPRTFDASPPAVANADPTVWNAGIVVQVVVESLVEIVEIISSGVALF